MSSAQLVEMQPVEMQLPFPQVADAVSTGGELTLSTGGVRDAALPLLTACVDAGYRAGG